MLMNDPSSSIQEATKFPCFTHIPLDTPSTPMLIALAQDVDTIRTEFDSGRHGVAPTLTALGHLSKEAHFQLLIHGMLSVRASS